MRSRTRTTRHIQWDKDDRADAGLVKFDLLGLGMPSALGESFDLLRTHYGIDLGLHQVPDGDGWCTT